MDQKVRTLAETSSERLKLILESPNLRHKFEALLLLEYPDIGNLFGLSEEEVQEYQNKFFKASYLIGLGRPFILDFLERTRQDKTLEMYLGGVDYTLARFGYSGKIDQEGKLSLKDRLVGSILLGGVSSPDIDTKIKCLKAIDDKIVTKEETSPIVEKIIDLFKDIKL